MPQIFLWLQRFTLHLKCNIFVIRLQKEIFYNCSISGIIFYLKGPNLQNCISESQFLYNNACCLITIASKIAFFLVKNWISKLGSSHTKSTTWILHYNLNNNLCHFSIVYNCLAKMEILNIKIQYAKFSVIRIWTS